VKTLVPDVVLMDVSMPRMGGVEATRQIKREFPHIGIVALTMYDEQQYIFDLVRAGATGYLLKDSESSQIVAAIRAIYKGESLIHPSVASKILAEFSLMSQKKGKKPGWVEHDLTEREITVLRLVADGKTNKEIANNLDLSEKTVKNHVRNIFHKLQVYDRTQAAILVFEKDSLSWILGRSCCKQQGKITQPDTRVATLPTLIYHHLSPTQLLTDHESFPSIQFWLPVGVIDPILGCMAPHR